MRQMMDKSSFAVACAVVLGLAASAWAVPYASGVRNTGGTNFEFVLNEAADSITINRTGDTPITISAPAAGRHTFTATGAYSIEVNKSAAAGWTSITDPNNMFDDFNIPSGVIINQDPTDLARFGTVYVGQAAVLPTKSGRAQGDGIYALTADMKGVDAATFAPVADPNDTTQAKGSAFFGVGGSLTSSPWRLSFDDSNNLIIADWSDPAGGVKYLNPSLTAGGRVLGGVNFDGVPVPDAVTGSEVATHTGPAGGIYSQESDEFGRLPLHGSSGAKVYATGSVGVDLTIYVMDEDLDKDLAVPNNDTNHIWRHDVGSATNYDAKAPTLVVDATAIPTNTDASVNLIGAFGPGVATGMLYSPQFGHWYVNQPRSNGDTSASVAIFDAALDGSNAANPTLLWSSIQFSIDNNLDGDLAVDPAPLADPNSDVFRRVRELSISPDGKYLVLHKNGVDSTAHIGMGDGAVFLLPLDENGIPDIEVVDGQVTNVINLTTLGDNGAHNSGAQIEWDAAGNLYVANSAVSTTSTDPLLTGQLVQVFSPGGNTKATTGSDGTFSVTELVETLIAGDFDGNGSVGNSDLTLLLDNWGDAVPPVPAGWTGSQPTVDAIGNDELTALLDTWGDTQAGLGSGTVPEPTSLGLLVLGMLGCMISSRRGRKAGA